MPVDTRLADTAQALLDNIGTELASRGIDVPDRKYITAGDVAQDFGQDCGEAFIVSWLRTLQGVLDSGTPTPGSRIQCAMPTIGTFNVYLIRCVSTLNEEGDPPSDARLQADGERILADAMTLPAVIADLSLSGDLLNEMCPSVAMNSVTAIGPLGGIGGTAVTVTIGLV